MKRFLKVSSLCLIALGILLICAGMGGILYTYKMVARENIITTKDSSIPNTPIRGPLTLKAQADIIRTHVLEMTENKTYSEIPQTSALRNTWQTAMTLINALHLGILAFAFSGLVLLLGLIFVWIGIVHYVLSKHYSDMINR